MSGYVYYVSRSIPSWPKLCATIARENFLKSFIAATKGLEGGYLSGYKIGCARPVLQKTIDRCDFANTCGVLSKTKVSVSSKTEEQLKSRNRFPAHALLSYLVLCYRHIASFVSYCQLTFTCIRREALKAV